MSQEINLDSIYVEALIKTGFTSRDISLKHKETLTLKVNEELAGYATRVLVKKREEIPNISPTCKEILETASKYYTEGGLSDTNQGELVNVVMKDFSKNPFEYAKAIDELMKHRHNMAKALIEGTKELLTVHKGFMPIFILTDSFEDELVFEFENEVYWVRMKADKLEDEPIIKECVEILKSDNLQKEIEKILANNIPEDIEEYKKLLS